MSSSTGQAAAYQPQRDRAVSELHHNQGEQVDGVRMMSSSLPKQSSSGSGPRSAATTINAIEGARCGLNPRTNTHSTTRSTFSTGGSNMTGGGTIRKDKGPTSKSTETTAQRSTHDASERAAAVTTATSTAASFSSFSSSSSSSVVDRRGRRRGGAAAAAAAPTVPSGSTERPTPASWKGPGGELDVEEIEPSQGPTTLEERMKERMDIVCRRLEKASKDGYLFRNGFHRHVWAALMDQPDTTIASTLESLFKGLCFLDVTAFHVTRTYEIIGVGKHDHVPSPLDRSGFTNNVWMVYGALIDYESTAYYPNSIPRDCDAPPFIKPVGCGISSLDLCKNRCSKFLCRRSCDTVKNSLGKISIIKDYEDPAVMFYPFFGDSLVFYEQIYHCRLNSLRYLKRLRDIMNQGMNNWSIVSKET